MALTKAQKAAKAATAAAAASSPQQVDAAPSAPAIKNTKKAGDNTRTVVVVSKMPRGLYLQLSQPVRQDVRVMGGGIEKREVAMRVGDQVRIKPTVLPFGAIPNYPIIDGFSLTRDVPAEFWRDYLEQNKNLTLITEGLLAAFDNELDASAYCREYAAKKHGLEPIAQNGDPRVAQSTSPNVSDIEIDSDTPRPNKVA